MLACYLQWHMMDASPELLFVDEDQRAKTTRAPVAPARRLADALPKAQTRVLEYGSVVHSFRTLLSYPGAIVGNQRQVPGAAPTAPLLVITTAPNTKQKRAYELLDSITV